MTAPAFISSDYAQQAAQEAFTQSIHNVIQIETVVRLMSDKQLDGDENEVDEQPQERKEEDVRDRAQEDRAMSGDPGGRLGDLDRELETQNYPITTNELVEAYGDFEIETQRGTEPLEEVLASTENQTYESADDVRSRLLGLIRR